MWEAIRAWFKRKDPESAALERLLGHQFRNPDLLERARTHRSLTNGLKPADHTANEKLEFLGDAVLNLIVAEHLYRKLPDKSEGDLSKLKAILVSGQSLGKLAREMDLGRFIRMSHSEERNGGRKRTSILEDTFEALVAALYLDGGKAAAERFVRKTVVAQLDELVRQGRDPNYKSQLLEYAQARGLPNPVYAVLRETGPDHAKTFEVEVSLNGNRLGRGLGRSKKSAEQNAARQAIEALTRK